MQYNIHQTLSIDRYFSLMIVFAFLILAALSDTIAAIQLGPIFSITSLIFEAKYLAVCKSNDRSESWYRYSLRDGVRRIKFQMDWWRPEVHSSRALRIKEITVL
jgi:hypothetical protein